MPEFRKVLKFLRERDGLSQAELAQKLELSTSTIGMYESGKRKPTVVNEELIADFFNVSLDFLRGRGENLQNTIVSATRIPVLGSVAAGLPIEAIEDILDYELIPNDLAKEGSFFALRIKGDSMEPDIKDGDTVIIRQQEIAESGDIVIASINGQDVICKRLVKYLDGFLLVSFNSKYQPMEFTPEKNKSVKILGKVIGLRRQYD